MYIYRITIYLAAFTIVFRSSDLPYLNAIEQFSIVGVSSRESHRGQSWGSHWEMNSPTRSAILDLSQIFRQTQCYMIKILEIQSPSQWLWIDHISSHQLGLGLNSSLDLNSDSSPTQITTLTPNPDSDWDLGLNSDYYNNHNFHSSSNLALVWFLTLTRTRSQSHPQLRFEFNLECYPNLSPNIDSNLLQDLFMFMINSIDGLRDGHLWEHGRYVPNQV